MQTPAKTTPRGNNRWLLDFAANVNSQNGEDGILAKVLEVIGVSNGWCVEFGAWDGRHLSNTYSLISDRGFSAVVIEGSTRRFRDLVATFRDNSRVTTVNSYVGFTAADGLDSILARTSIPPDFDVLSVDIDGNDYHVWRAVTLYTPKVVLIEYNPTIPSAVEFVQPADMAINQGSSMLSLSLLAREKGYELVAATEHNCFFVKSQFFHLFGIDDNSVAAIRPDEALVTYIFNGFDGTVFVRGYGRLAWHGIPYRESKVQQIPRVLRRFPSTYGPLMRVLSRYYRSLKKRGIL
jgi:hypothetical protein